MANADLIARARNAAKRAHSPYSGFCVGCVVEAADGQVAAGSNMENASYAVGVCAEMIALGAAKQAFGLENIVRLAVAGGKLDPDGRLQGAAVVTPCGACRQAIFEAAQISGRDIEILCASGDGQTVEIRKISDLLPAAFGPKNL